MADRIAYLVSQYPTLSHSFIFREIQELRKLGMHIEVASILQPDRPPPQLTPDERDESNRTYYVRADAKRWPVIHLTTLFQMPACYCRGLLLALASAKWSLLQASRHLRYFGEAIVAGHWARSRGIGHVHTHFASLTAMLVEKVFGLSLSITIHGSDEFIDPAGFCMAEKVRASRIVFGISRYGCSQIMRFSHACDWHKVAMVRLGINPSDFKPGVPHAPGEHFRIICVGRLVPVKAYRFLIRAAALLRNHQKSVHLTIIGGGPDRADLAALIQQLDLGAIVALTGALPNQEVRARVSDADCFALASFAEGVPVVLMEAMALAIPCVATRVTGVPELIEDGLEGLLVPPADVEALTAAIERLIDEPELRATLAANARAKVLRDYDLRQNARELRDQLLAVTAGTGR